MSWARRWSCTQYPPRVDADGESSRRCLAPKVVPIVVGSPDLARWRGTAESPACPLEQRQLQLEVGDAVRGVGRAERLRHQIDVVGAVSYTHLRAHETRHDLVCRLLLEKKKK